MGSGSRQVGIRFQSPGCAVVQDKLGDRHRDLESHERVSTEETAFLPWTKMAQMNLDSILLPQSHSLASWTLAQILNAGNWAPVSSGTRTVLALKYAQLSFPARMEARDSTNRFHFPTVRPALGLFAFDIWPQIWNRRLREAMDSSVHSHYHPLRQGASRLRLLGKTSEALI